MELGVLIALCLVVLECALILDPFNGITELKRFEVVFFALYVLIFIKYRISFGAFELAPLTAILLVFSWCALSRAKRGFDILVAFLIGVTVSLISIYNPRILFALFAAGIGIASGAAAEKRADALLFVTGATVTAEVFSCAIDFFSSGSAAFTVGITPGGSALVAAVCIAYAVYALKLRLLRSCRAQRESE